VRGFNGFGGLELAARENEDDLAATQVSPPPSGIDEAILLRCAGRLNTSMGKLGGGSGKKTQPSLSNLGVISRVGRNSIMRRGVPDRLRRSRVEGEAAPARSDDQEWAAVQERFSR
jgi:hypothetical protein